MTSILSLRDVQFAWPNASPLLDIAQFEMAPGERVFLQGASGSGKSTLLGLISGILIPSHGTLTVLDCDMHMASGHQRDALRARDMGVIFQMFNLLPFLSVLQNVTLACQFSKARKARVEAHVPEGVEAGARALLARLGLGDEAILQRQVSDLSVGQQQRVAVARALLGSPKLVIADEPTSALDAGARDGFMDLLFSEITRSGAALLMVSHDGALADGFDRSLDLRELNKASQTEVAL